MKYPIIFYNGWKITRQLFTNGIKKKRFFIIDQVNEKFETLKNAKNYIDFLAK